MVYENKSKALLLNTELNTAMIDKLRAFLKLNEIVIKPIEGTTDLFSFSLEDLNFVVQYDKEKDPSYFQMLLPKVEDYTQWDEHLTKLNSKFKTGKVSIIDNQIWLSVETFVYGNVDAPALFIRMISILKEMIIDIRKN